MDSPAERIKWARRNRTNYATATEAARAFGWTVPTYLGHENGDRSPSRKAAMAYAKAYRVPWEWILEGGPLPSRKGRTGPIPTRGEVAAGLWLDFVIVERRRAQASQREVTAKRIHRRGRLIVLFPDSTEAKWKPIEFDPKAQATEDETVEVIAIVLAIYKPLRK